MLVKKTVAIIFGLSILGAAYFLAHAYKTRGQSHGTVSVTGLGSVNFESDEILWKATYTVKNKDLTSAFEKIKKDRAAVEAYLLEQGIAPEEVSFQQVDVREEERSIYSAGRYVGSEFEGYSLSQSVIVSSKMLDLVSKTSREISELLNQGIQIHSNQPEYYYSDLDALKLNLIEKASANGRTRAEQIAQHSKSDLRSLKSARLGVFQILGQNSGESFSWSGTFNTANRYKTASITVKMEFEVD